MALFGGMTMNALAGALPGMIEEEQPQKRRGGGLFGGLRNGGGGFDWGRAALGFFGGDSALRAMQQRDALRLRQQEAEAEQAQEAQLRAQAAEALAARGYRKSDIGGMRPEEVSRLLL